jgi:hypothetical protein
MPSLDHLLSNLEQAKREFGRNKPSLIVKLLDQIGRRRFDDARSLIRFHEALLFIRSHPQSEEALQKSDELLSSFGGRLERLLESGADLLLFDYIEYSGIAGTTLSGTFSYAIARWLIERYADKVDVDWERNEKKGRLVSVLVQLLPLFYEDSLVEANGPHLTWLRAAKKSAGRDLEWIIKRIERLPLSERRKSELYDSLELYIYWELGNSRASRTRNIRPARKAFYHT